ncbi:hypothetical protein NBRC110019_15250 [Neptunitalea chrysea]|uniref:Outer membrane protein beta-barrel domain-containing protein n=1 Tax=Neptunitalea chrysea TaxID=1647581 RepID=A0A9W6B6H2_9FLAO|nr:outer membrane beta-barrel protein [Neptunitalea chrysea]GLB52485.1 hypothetical protein NBRC110019_15250 [Neptunitalea chrysea]
MKQFIFFTILLLLAITAKLHAQDTTDQMERKGFVIGLGISGGAISISDTETGQDFDKGQGSLSLPNIKLGYMVNERLAVLLNTSGMIYSQNEYDRSFETFLPSVQYWVKNNLWISGGIGLAIDMPALYDVEDNLNDDFNAGCAVGLSVGHEIYQQKNFAIDLQLQTTAGRTFFKGDGHRDAATISVGVGFNWY